MPRNDQQIEQEDIATRRTAKKVYKTEKAKKAAEQKDYIPLVDPKHTIEVAVKAKPNFEELMTIEKPGKKIKTKNTRTRNSKRKGVSSKAYSDNLDGDSTLIITEKPQAAAKISAALSGGRARQQKGGAGVYFYEFAKGGKNIIVACAVGHLFSLSQDIKGHSYPIFDISWKPNFEVRKKDFTRKYYTNIKKLVNRAKEIVIATDYDVEGEVIGYNVVRYIAGQKDAKRMKFSSLTVKELEEAYNNIQPHINWGQALGGETRHYLDWFYGINLSRALMNSIKTTGSFKIMSVGRVQGPALNLIVKKEKEIQAFKSSTFWKVFLDLEQKDKKVRVKYIKDVEKEEELDKFKNLKDKKISVETKKTKQIIEPPHPFDLTTLQTESYKFFSLNPSRTLQIAQKLYLEGLISYPRTSSQKIPDAINPKHIIKRLKNNFEKEIKLITRKNPIEGKKSDPAHPSIYPTGEFQMLSGDEKKIYELIVQRFISCFCGDAKIENKTITATTLDKDKLRFKVKGLEVIEKAWMQVYKTKMKEEEIQDIEGKADIKEVTIEEDQTKPPRRYSPASILRELEKRSLGTKATRASILERLYDRGYITDQKSIRATPLGINLIGSLEKHSPIIIDEALTREIEEDMEIMHTTDDKKTLEEKQREVIDNSKKAIEKISKDFHKNEKAIGKELVTATKKAWKQEAKDNELDFTCPLCKKGKLTMKYSPKFRRNFIGCNSYPTCKNTFGLPPNGLIKKTEKTCEHCQFPIMMRIMKGKSPWFFCFNMECPGKEEYNKNNNSYKE